MAPLLGEHRAAVDEALTAALKAGNDGAKALAELNGDILTDPFSHDAAAESAQDVKNAMKALGEQPPQIPEDDPKAAAEWWKALSPEERQTYTTLYPKEIGATDGLPTDVRDDANRTALAQELNLLQEGNYDEGFPGESDETVNRRLNNLQLLNDKIEARDGAPKGKELYLLGYDSKDDGRAVIANELGTGRVPAHRCRPGRATRLSRSLRRHSANDEGPCRQGGQGGRDRGRFAHRLGDRARPDGDRRQLEARARRSARPRPSRRGQPQVVGGRS
ncbi:HMG-box domain-containing protein [Streptomyces sp. DG2A-72]|uniref:HMG-box domain-containing protein n=1 Tax=Streptomyces sp. DG2A-72 TaxID=3051386 RepID=UPI00265C0251|nr:HMG-box domain-containing protein [Streptomyces sp. DG2A-72]MDO0937038.1 HMG-box domain-containing protein [Streptomyces sp. DG2A-72]